MTAPANENPSLGGDLEVQVSHAHAAALRESGAKSEFITAMSHELRTPLNAMLGFAELIQLSGAEAPVSEYADAILKAGNHLVGILNDVLDLSRIEAGRLALHLEPVPVAEIVEEVSALLRPLAASRSITVTVGSGLDGRHVRADRQRLGQVLVNILANAIKYNSDGGSVTIDGAAGPDGTLRIEITDTGPGIDNAESIRLFQPFERLGSAGRVEGTGLGLALSQRLIEAMNGRIGVRSSRGNGATFWLELDVVQAPREGAAPPAPASDLMRADTPPRTILYIEDTESNIRLVARMLDMRPSVTLVTAVNGTDGIAAAHEHMPDLILLDMHLPDIDGLDVLSALREDSATSSIPIAALSADATQQRIDAALAGGAITYITKPVPVKVFLARVDELLGRTPTRSRVSPTPL